MFETGYLVVGVGASGTARIHLQSSGLALGESQVMLVIAPERETTKLDGTKRAAGARPFTPIARDRSARDSITTPPPRDPAAASAVTD